MSDVTQILEKIERGDPAAAEWLFPLVYEELKLFRISDAVQGNGTSTEQRMLDRLQSLQGVPPHQLLPQLRQTVLDELTADGPDDDMTLMLLSANGGQPPVQGVGDKFRVIAKMIGLPIGR